MQRAGQARLLSFRKNKRSKNMSNKWAFIGGILAGIAGVFTAAAISVEMEDRGVSSRDTVGEPEKLALPE
jgi:hypothetical protein